MGDSSEKGKVLLGKCPLHREKMDLDGFPIPIRFKPQNAGVRVLCLDG